MPEVRKDHTREFPMPVIPEGEHHSPLTLGDKIAVGVIAVVVLLLFWIS